MGGISDELRRERAAFLRTLVQVGPDEPTACGSWTTTDLAVHVASGEMAGGLLSAGGRLFVGWGVRVDRLASANATTLERLRRRYGFDWALDHLDHDPPLLQRSGPIGAVSLLEVWAHHEDVRASHDVATRDEDLDLGAVLGLLARYQRGPLRLHRVQLCSAGRVWSGRPGDDADRDDDVEVQGTVTALCQWLAGRSDADGLRLTGPPDACASVRSLELRI